MTTETKTDAATAAKAPRKAKAKAEGETGAAVIRKKELIDRVVTATGAKKKVAKEVIEATLKVLGEALGKGEVLAVPPFGKARVNKHKDLASGEMLTVKLRRGAGSPEAKAAKVAARKAAKAAPQEALAEPAE